jgi:hypothetical protein
METTDRRMLQPDVRLDPAPDDRSISAQLPRSIAGAQRYKLVSQTTPPTLKHELRVVLCLPQFRSLVSLRRSEPANLGLKLCNLKPQGLDAAAERTLSPVYLALEARHSRRQSRTLLGEQCQLALCGIRAC